MALGAVTAAFHNHSMAAASPLLEPPAPRKRHAVFISDFVHIGRPFDETATKLLDLDSRWPSVAKRSAGWQVGEPRRSSASVIFPVSWEAQTLERLLPTFEADVELSSLGDGQCRLAMSGSYRVPGAQLGARLDRLAMHRVAEAAARRFLGDLAAALEES